MDQIGDALHDALDNLPASGNSSSGGGSGSGGGGGRGNSGSSNISVVTPSVPESSEPEASSEPDNTETGTFHDLADVAWAQESVQALYDRGIVNGKEEGVFAPHDLVTKEEFTKMLLAAIGETAQPGTPVFADVEASAWYAPYVQTAYEIGIVNGEDETHFGIGLAITREEMAVMIYRGLNRKNIVPEAVASVNYTDAVSAFAQEAVQSISAAGIMNGKGDGVFDGASPATRAEAAKVIYGMIQLMEQEG